MKTPLIPKGTLLMTVFSKPSHAESISPQDCEWTLNCENENRSHPSANVLAPGGGIRTSLGNDVPGSVAELGCELSPFIAARIRNHDFLGEINGGKSVVDNCAARKEQPLVDRFDEKECQSKIQRHQQDLTLPDDMPESTGRLLVQIQGGKTGAAGKTECGKDIKIEHF